MEKTTTSYLTPEVTVLELQMEQCLALSDFEYLDDGFEY
jgi:hypothetical protein